MTLKVNQGLSCIVVRYSTSSGLLLISTDPGLSFFRLWVYPIALHRAPEKVIKGKVVRCSRSRSFKVIKTGIIIIIFISP